MDGSPILGRSPPSSPARGRLPKAAKSSCYFIQGRGAWMACVVIKGKAKYKSFKVMSPKSERRKRATRAVAEAWIRDMMS